MGLKADFLKVTDLLLGRPLCWLAGPSLSRLARRPIAASEPGRVLVIRPGGIGDAVLFIPALRGLRHAWPAARIEVLLERRNAGVLDGAEFIDEVLLYDRFPRDLWRVLRRRYDVVIDTEQYHCLSALLAGVSRAPVRVGFATNARRRLFSVGLPYSQELYEVYSFLSLVAGATGRQPTWDPNAPFHPLSSRALQFAHEKLAPLAGRRVAAFNPGASIPERRWPSERYGAVAAALAREGVGVVILGGRDDRAAAAVVERAVGAGVVNLAGVTTLAEAAAVLSKVDIYVSADTGLLHLAYAVGTPTVHLFGPGVLTKWGPPGRRYTTIAAQAPCSPCTIYGYTPPCCQGMICMLGITPETVLAAVRCRLDASAVAGATTSGAREAVP